MPTRSGTAPFTVLGTAGYMAPEQVRGQPVDHRADIFSFGAVLYEMVTARRAFGGDTTADTMSAILREAPPPIQATLDRPVPPSLLRIIDRCLEKSPSGRFRSTTDLAFALKSLSHGDTGAGTRIARGEAELVRSDPRWRRLMPSAIAAAGVVVAIAAWIWRPMPSSPSPVGSGFTFSIDPPEGTAFRASLVAPFPAISPNGEELAFVAARPYERPMIWLRGLRTGEPRPLAAHAGNECVLLVCR
jgi:serine/threonine protein kinase